ncbi:MAG: hypothetical protein ACFFCT_03795 [Candidatus Odinarchaeota archaeon]
MPSLDDVSVRIWSRDGTSNNGSIIINREGMSIRLGTGKTISIKEGMDILYEMNVQIIPEMNGRQKTTDLKSPVRISLKPSVLTYRTYNPQGGQYIEDVFPPSTLGFYGRMKSGNEQFLYIAQEIENDSRLWLTIANPKTGQILEAHPIYKYEAGALSLIDSQEFSIIWSEAIGSAIPSSEREEVLSVLDSPSVSWSDFAKLLGDISIPNPKLGKTMRETLTRIIPSSFPSEVQEQLMLFLAFIIKKGVPTEDPITYLNKFWSFPIFGALLEGHLMFMADEAEWPPYLKLITLADRKHLIAPTRAIDDIVSDSPWLLFWQKTVEQFPNWFDIAAGVVKELNDRGQVTIKSPVTESAAKKSKDSWKKRLAILTYELRIVGKVNSHVLGLNELVYLGAAYRWPHRHMRFITRLGSSGDNSPYLQVLVMPPSAATLVKRVLPSIMDVSWSVRTSNIDLFNIEKKTWEIPTERIISSIGNVSSIKKMTNRFGIEKSVDSYRITKEEAKIADLVTEGIRLSGLERSEYLAPWGLDRKKVQHLLSNLSDRGVIQLFYDASDQKLISLATIIHGPSEKVLSLCSSFLEYTPTTLAMLGDGGQQSILLSRLPETPAYELATQLAILGIEQGLTIRCLRPTTFQSYSHNLYQRLLKEDGAWDDDVSAFLSQARAKRRELSETNA